jgi:hypothetical protein
VALGLIILLPVALRWPWDVSRDLATALYAPVIKLAFTLTWFQIFHVGDIRIRTNVHFYRHKKANEIYEGVLHRLNGFPLLQFTVKVGYRYDTADLITKPQVTCPTRIKAVGFSLHLAWQPTSIHEGIVHA